MKMLSAHRAVVRNLVNKSVRQAYRKEPRLIHLRTTFPVTPLRDERWRAHSLLVRNYAMTLSTSWVSTWATSWFQHTKDKPSGGGGGGGTGGPPPSTDPRRLSVPQLVEMLGESSNYVVHRTSNKAVGTLKVKLEALKPAPGEHAAPGVYVMRGISGVDYGPWGVVFRYDGRFRQYTNGEIISHHDLEPDEAVGWYHVDDLNAALGQRG